MMVLRCARCCCHRYCDNIRDLGQAYLDKSGRPDNAQKTSDLYLEAHSDVGRAKRRAGHVTYRR